MDELLIRRSMMMNTEHDFTTPGWDGRIWAYYYTSSADQQVTLLYNTINIGSTMEVDGTSVSRATTYTFADTGYHLVKFTIVGNLINQFRNCSDLRKIYFPPTTMSGSMNYLLYSCNNLEIVNMPNSVNMPTIQATGTKRSSGGTVEILNAASWANTILHNNISNVTVKGTFSSMPANGICGFDAENNFNYIWIESPNLTTIGNGFCRYSKYVTTVVMNIETPPTVSSTNFMQGSTSNLKIYVPYSADHSILNAWKTADVWSGKASYMYELTPDGTIPT